MYGSSNQRQIIIIIRKNINSPLLWRNKNSIIFYNLLKNMHNIYKKIVQLSFEEYILIFVAFLFLFFSKLVLLFFPLKKLAPRLGIINQTLNTNLNSSQELKALQIKIAVARAARLVPWRSVCIDQAMTGLMMLSRHKIPSSLCLGVKKENNENKLLAHAWIVCGNRILIGGRESRGFKLVSTFVRNH